MWAAQFITYEKPATWLNSGGAGTMGYAVPAAMGAKAGRPDRTVWAIDGDGCFQMTNQELATCALNNIPIKVAIINNGALGHGPAVADPVLRPALLQHRAALRCRDVRLTRRRPAEPRHPRPGLRQARRGDGLRRPALRVARTTWTRSIEKAMAINDRPVVIDFIVHEDAMVWPMVAAGTSNDEIMAARDVRPDFGDNEDD